MKKISILLLGGAFLFVSAMGAQAVPVTNVDGKWTALNGSATNVSELDSKEIGWGTLPSCCCCNLGKNGLLFESADISNTSTAFSLGTLTHFNSPILSGTGAESAVLSLSFDIGVTSKTFDLKLGIDETPNSNTPADDIISFPDFNLPAFSAVGSDYIFELLGFGDSAATLVSEFSTEECAENSVQLWAKVSSIPEPAPLLLIGLGLISLAGFKRKLKR